MKCEDNIVEVPFDKEHLFEQILSPANLNRAYKAVIRNKGCGGVSTGCHVNNCSHG